MLFASPWRFLFRFNLIMSSFITHRCRMRMIIARKAHFKLTAFVLEITMLLGYYNSFSCQIVVGFEIENSSTLLRYIWIITMHNHTDIIPLAFDWCFNLVRSYWNFEPRHRLRRKNSIVINANANKWNLIGFCSAYNYLILFTNYL